MAIIQEYFGKADKTVEHVSLSLGNITVYITDNTAIIFESLRDFVDYIAYGTEVTRVYAKEYNLMEIYDKYNSFDEILQSGKYDTVKII